MIFFYKLYNDYAMGAKVKIDITNLDGHHFAIAWSIAFRYPRERRYIRERQEGSFISRSPLSEKREAEYILTQIKKPHELACLVRIEKG